MESGWKKPPGPVVPSDAAYRYRTLEGEENRRRIYRDPDTGAQSDASGEIFATGVSHQ